MVSRELCMHPADFDQLLLPKTFTIEEKLDGMRGIAIAGPSCLAGESRLMTRNGVDIKNGVEAFKSLIWTLTATGFNKTMMLDGELVSGTAAETTSRARAGRIEGMTFHVFDAIPRSNFLTRTIDKTTLFDRKMRLFAAWEKAFGSRLEVARDGVSIKLHGDLFGIRRDPFIRTSPLNIDEAMAQVRTRNGEGIVVKDLDSPYVFTKSFFWMKRKFFATVDLEVRSTRVTADGQRMVDLVGRMSGAAVEASLPLRDSSATPPVGAIFEVEYVEVLPSGYLKHARLARRREDKEQAA